MATAGVSMGLPNLRRVDILPRMKHQWVAYAIVAVLSIGAGVAIAGAPSSSNVAPTIVVAALPATTVQPTTTVAEVAATDPVVPTSTDAPTTTVAPATTVAPEPTTTVPEPVPDRSEVAVVVANGADIGGIASATANDLEDLGYVGVRVRDGTDIVPLTIVYYVDGFELSAARLAIDLGLEPSAILPIADAPDIIGELQDGSLLAYLGSDQG
jgi:hypothetical protein